MKHAKRKPSLIRPGFIVGINAVAFRAEIDASRITILGRYIHDPKRSRPFLCVHTDGDSCAWTPLTSSQYSADVRRIHVDGGSYLRGPCYLFEGPRASWTTCMRDQRRYAAQDVLLEVRRAIAEHFPALREALGVAA